jgi:type III secretion protein N (ATPase)
LIAKTIGAVAHAVLPDAPSPKDRTPITRPFWTGVRAVDALLTLGCGARIGIFGPPGAGKSTLLHAIVRNADADAVVVGLVGERGREAEEWNRAAPAHATIVCATSDRSASSRVAAAQTAMVQADALRARGLDVLLVLDSLARYSAALRDVALAAGEPTGRAGYPPSVFAAMARFLEVAGTACGGSITLIATVLSDGDERDPVSDAARSLLDGHIQLCAKLAARGLYPAIDLLQSSSRTMTAVTGETHREHAAILRGALGRLAATEDARSLGMEPSDGATRRAAAAEPEIEAFLRQGSEGERPGGTLSALARLADTLR